MTQETFIVSIPLADTANDWQADDKTGHLFRAPSSGKGDGITIIGADVINAATHTSGTAVALQLENWGTAGTAVSGTIVASMAGTADPLIAGTPKAMTIASGFVDAGEWVVLRKDEQGGSADFTRGMITIQYQMGR